MTGKDLKKLSERLGAKYGFTKMAIALDQSKIAPKAIEVCRMLQEKGYQAYLVGGCVRDLLMGGKPKDWDIATNAKPEQVKEVFPKTYDTGIQHGTITVSMGPTVADHFEVTTYRTEGDYTDGRRPDSVAFVDEIEADLARRDLTINAVAYDPVSNTIVDPFGGTKDLENGVIKAVGDPNARFSEDGLRTMRVARFAARLGFTVDPATQAAISNNLGVLSKVSKERMRDELTKTLATSSPSTGLHILNDTGALAVLDPIFADPGLQRLFGRVEACQGSMETKVAVLLHRSPLAAVEAALRNLKFSNSEIKKILFPFLAAKEFSKFHAAPTALEARKFLSYVKNNGPEGYEKSLQEFIEFAHATGLDKVTELKEMFNEPVISRKELDISGNDLMAQLNVPPGPQIKKILDHLYNEVLSNPTLNEKSKLLDLAAKFEKVAVLALKETRMKRANDWWRLSEEEEEALLNKEYDFGNGIKFKVRDVPELAAQVEVPAGPEEHHPEKNQLLHNNMVYDKARELSDDPMVWFAAALHDLGKSYTDKAKWPKQHGHEMGGVPFVQRVSDMLGVSEEWKEFASLVAENHLKCHKAKELTPKTLRKLFEAFKSNKELFMAYLTSCEADAKGRMGGYADKPYEQKDYLSRKIEEGFEPKKNPSSNLAVSGNDVMQALGLKPGPDLGRIMKTLKEMVEADSSINDKETLLGIAKSLLVK